MKYNKVITALITPFNKGKVDFESLENLVAHQLKNKIEGFVVQGTTGESPTVSNDEKIEIFKFIKKNVPKDFLLIYGSGTNDTKTTIEYSKQAEQLGADAVLTVVPYYNKPPQRGLYEHFKKIAEAIKIPVILYNVPGRTITSLNVETIKSLSEIKNIIGIKEATGNIEFEKEIIKTCGKEFVMLTGDDGTFDQFMIAGGHGVISVSSHIIPRQMISCRDLVLSGKFKEAELQYSKYKKLIDLLFVEANPIPIKMSLYKMGIIKSPELRLPLVEMDVKLANQLIEEMKKCEIIA